MPSKNSRPQRKGIHKEDDSNNIYNIERDKIVGTSIRLDKENEKQEKEDIYKINPNHGKGGRFKLDQYPYERLKDIDNNKGCLFDFTPEAHKVSSMDDVFNSAYDLNIVFDIKLKSMLLNKDLRIQFVKDAIQRKNNYDLNKNEDENSVSVFVQKYCQLPDNFTANQLAAKRHQVNALCQFISMATCERLDLTTPKMRDEGILDMTTKNRLYFYRNVELEQKLLNTYSSRHKIRKYNEDAGEFEYYIKG